MSYDDDDGADDDDYDSIGVNQAIMVLSIRPPTLCIRVKPIGSVLPCYVSGHTLFVTHLYIEYAEYRLALIESPTWGRSPERLQEAKRAITTSFYSTIFMGILLYASSSVTVTFWTWEMDRRASDILTGFSRMFAGVVFLLLSINLPQWMGCYFSVVDSYKTNVATFRTIREVRFGLSWNLWKQLASMFVFNLYFSCRTDEYTALYGFLVGVPLGMFFILIAYLARVKFPKRNNRWFAGIMGFFLAFTSIGLVYVGALYIEDVWHEDYKNQRYSYSDISFSTVIISVWTLVTLGFHVLAICITRKYTGNQEIGYRYRPSVFQTAIPGIKGLARITSKVTEKDDSSSIDRTEEPNRSNAENNPNRENDDDDDDNDDAVDHTNEGFEIKVLQSDKKITSTKDYGTSKSSQTGNDVLMNSSEGPTYSYLCRRKLYETYGFCCCCSLCHCCCKDVKDDNNISCEENKMMHPIDQIKKDSRCWRFFDGTKWFLWYSLSAFFLYLTIVNCAATTQQVIVRQNLHKAFEYLYPADYHTGPMCGWSEPTEYGDIRSFDSLEELRAANYYLIHCGYCGECSNWNDLSKQWTTRTFLAEASRKCAQKSLLGGVDAVQACNEAEPLGFTPGCAECWTVDELCAKKNCFWIFLQSTLINAVSDYRVQPNDITSATCDEAMCGPEFVPCSGATRRRMNIKSDIKRPLYQQCIYQDADWSVIFNHP
ncbi:hypothetical protein IV203_033635 [Nitzschia inconspicua]|uniref:Uncharacterized protein n=1 Tax=Nitzschia inconspicua TaxID=303405 RepID=A0A9K3Q6X8_9STRA|nr:hypothetical protein IV203_033635 [Nitzschia inconspicua]